MLCVMFGTGPNAFHVADTRAVCRSHQVLRYVPTITVLQRNAGNERAQEGADTFTRMFRDVWKQELVEC